MFNDIAPSYDRLNHTLSLGIDRYWRKKMVKELPPDAHYVLDLATGTGDLAIALLKQFPNLEIEAVDFSEKMLETAQKKVKDTPWFPKINFKQADAMALPYESDSFDACTIAFGVRNFENLLQGLQEVYRILKPGGNLIILEFGTPPIRPVNRCYKFYNQTWLPWWGKHVSKNNEAYNYLPASIETFPCRQSFLNVLTSLPFQKATYKNLALGIVNIYKAVK